MSENEPQATQDNVPSSEAVTEADFDTTIAQTLTDERASSDPSLVVDVEGFEGPLDLLLMLARTQKVDLSKISILALADQYLQFIEAARKLRLELAADYLVMAAWLAYLKSRLLLPRTAEEGGQTAEDMALALAHRLRRLEAFRSVAAQLMGRPQYDRDVFGRGAPKRSRMRSGRRRFTTCSRPIPCSASIRRWRACGLPNAKPGRWPKRARRWSG
jgi:segregation and condensation protein A